MTLQNTSNMKLRGCGLVLLFVVLSPFLSICQQELDSLRSIWKNQSLSDSLRADAMAQLAWDGYLFSQPESAFYLADQALSITQNKTVISRLSNVQAISLHTRGKYPEALEFYQKALKLNKELNAKSPLASTLSNIGILYEKMKDYDKAIEYYEESLKIRREINNQKGIAIALNNIGNIYDIRSDKEKALEHYQESLEIRKSINDLKGSAGVLHNIGGIYKDLGNYNKAVDYIGESILLREELNDLRGLAKGHYVLGGIHQQKNQLSEALDHCMKSREIALKSENIETRRVACRCLYEVNKAIGQPLKALEFFEEYNAIEDSLKLEETNKKLREMELKKQAEVDSLEKAEEMLKVQLIHQEAIGRKDKFRNRLIIAGISILIIALALYGRVRYVKRSKDQIAAEKERSDELLLNILPEKVAEQLKKSGKAEAQRFDEVTVLFSDFVGFTKIAESMEPEQLVEEINICFMAFDEIVNKYNIEKIKTIGDAYMAAGGLPVPGKDSAERVVRAALEMQEFITDLSNKRESLNEPAFRMRVGIHTGPVVAGIVGSKKFQYDIWGDTVNTASRMESNGIINEVNISETTFKNMGDQSKLSFEERKEVPVKGKGMMKMYLVKKSDASHLNSPV